MKFCTQLKSRKIDRKRPTPRRHPVGMMLVPGIFALSLCFGTAGCASDAAAGGAIGAGIGALAGQAIGHDTTSTVIGTAVGAVGGYMIGNESDKQKMRNRGYSDW